MKFGIQILQKAQRSSIRMMLKFADIQKKIRSSGCSKNDASKCVFYFNQVHFFLENEASRLQVLSFFEGPSCGY